ncbi:MAG: hypothetical protein M3305_12490 [Actinomycetota bacterium]|nr:hypothetical protein [Actinomycetota bacterium]
MNNPLTRSLRSRGALPLAGAGLILITGLIHLVLTPEHFREATYLGLLFVADFVAAAVAAFGIYREQRWGWMLGAFIAGSAFVLYTISGTVGLPGAERGHFLDPVGLITKTIEVLFLALCIFEFAGLFTGFRRWALMSGIAAVLVVPGSAVALGLLPVAHAEHGQQKGAGKTPGLPVQWKATSPAIHKGDQYSLVMTNTGDKDQKARVRSIIMDHSNHTNTNVVDEQVNLAPGEEREFTAVNDYGSANHFNTLIGSEKKDLDLSVKVADSSGNETAQFNQKAFLVKGKAKS